MTELYQTTSCPVCGKDVEQTGKGRPREYHPECRELNNLMTFMETRVTDTPPEEQTKEMRLFVRSNLQRILNHTNGWGK